MELIVSEKEIAARRVAEILSDKSAKVRKINKINVYEWDGAKCMGLSGHVVGVDFPKKYSDWNKIDPEELIEALPQVGDIIQNIWVALVIDFIADICHQPYQHYLTFRDGWRYQVAIEAIRQGTGWTQIAE